MASAEFGQVSDWQMWLEAAHRGLDAGFVPCPTVRLRQHAGQDTYHMKDPVALHMAVWRYWGARGYRPSPEGYWGIQRTAMGISHYAQQDALPALQELGEIFNG
jgi:hypothetical protein